MKHLPILKRKTNRDGFTLVELVVVVLILGIIAAVAAPKMFNVSGTARENTTFESLNVIRDAIEIYNATQGSYPGADGLEATFKLNMQSHLRGTFPICQVGFQNATVRIETAGTPLTVSGTQGWAYDSTTGEFIINSADLSDGGLGPAFSTF